MARYNDAGGSSNYCRNRREEDEEDDLIISMSAEMMLMERLDSRTRDKIPHHDGSLTGRQWVDQLINGHYKRSIENMRITVDSFLRLCDILVQNGYVPQNYHKRVAIEESLAMTMVMISHKHTQRILGERFNRSTETINRNVREVLCGLCMFASTIIRPVDETEVHPRIANNRQFYPWFKDAIGAIDGTHVHACPPSGEQMAYTNRKGFQSQNVLAVCDHNMRFIYVYPGWEGSAHDARVLASALSHPSDFPLPGPGKYYLVDAAYKNVPGFMPPYKNIGNGSPEKKLFNTRHSQLRNVIERTFGVLKQRFKFLKGEVPNFYMSTQISVVIACCAIHNFLRMMQPGDAHFQMYENENMEMDEEPVGNSMPPRQPVNASREEIEEWKAKRDYIANEMYAARGRRRR